MATTLTIKGQVTIPKQIRDALDLKPGSKVTFGVNSAGEVVLEKTGRTTTRPDRFELVLGVCRTFEF